MQSRTFVISSFSYSLKDVVGKDYQQFEASLHILTAANNFLAVMTEPHKPDRKLKSRVGK